MIFLYDTLKISSIKYYLLKIRFFGWNQVDDKNARGIGEGVLSFHSSFVQEGSSISRQNLETLQIAHPLFYHLPGFYLKTGFLNSHPLSLFYPGYKMDIIPQGRPWQMTTGHIIFIIPTEAEHLILRI